MSEPGIGERTPRDHDSADASQSTALLSECAPTNIVIYEQSGSPRAILSLLDLQLEEFWGLPPTQWMLIEHIFRQRPMGARSRLHRPYDYAL